MYTLSISIISTSKRIQISSDIAGRMVSINCGSNVVYFAHPELCNVAGALAIFCLIFFLTSLFSIEGTHQLSLLVLSTGESFGKPELCL